MPWAANIAKTMPSKMKQLTVTHEMLTAVARDQRWRDVVAGISARFSNLILFCFVLFRYILNKSLNSNLNVSLDFVLGNIEILGKQNSLFPSEPVIKC